MVKRKITKRKTTKYKVIKKNPKLRRSRKNPELITYSLSEWDSHIDDIEEMIDDALSEKSNIKKFDGLFKALVTFIRIEAAYTERIERSYINKNIKIFDMSSDHPNQEYLKWIKYNKKMEDTIKSLMLDLIK